MSETKEVTTPKRAGVVRYKYIPKRVHGVTNPKHVLYDGKLDGSIDKFAPYRDQTNRWRVKLTEEEIEWLTDKLGLGPNDLNVNMPNNTYFQNMEIEVPKNGLILDTTKPRDFLIDKVLLGFDNIFAPNEKSKQNRRSYRYVRLQENEETKIYLEDSDLKKNVYKKLGALEESREQMIMFLLNSGMRFNKGVETVDLRKYVNEFAEEKPKVFIEIMEDKLFVEKGILNMARILKIVDVKSKMYYYDDEPIAFEGSVANLENAAIYLADSEQGELRLAISEKALDEFNGVN